VIRSCYSEQADELPLSNIAAWSCNKQLQQHLPDVLSNDWAIAASRKIIEDIVFELFIGI